MILRGTSRLVLRAWEQADADAFFAIYSRDEVTRWLGPQPRNPVGSVEEAGARLDRWIEFSAGLSRPFGLWAIVPRADDAAVPVGTVLLLPLHDADGPTGLIEVGWHLRPDVQGQGFATEAARGVLGTAVDAGISEVLALTDLDNAPSQAVCGRLGMADEGATGRWFGLTTRQFRFAFAPTLEA